MVGKVGAKAAFLTLEDAVKVNFMERSEEAHGLSLAALSGHHLFFIGPPGTAKSAMVRWYTAHIDGARYFNWLLTRFSTPEELFGPVDLQALKNGSYRRITLGKLPEADVAFLDETFKGNSAILNSLLSVLQERIYHNDGQPIRCPLIFAVGASNELPEADESLSALYDRFLLRYNCGYIKDEGKFVELLKNAIGTPYAGKITLAQLQEARQEVQALPVGQDMIQALAELRRALRSSGFVPSDRRFVQSLDVLRAEAWLRGDKQVEPDCLEVGAAIFWDKPEDARKVRGLCLQVCNPNIFRATEMMEAAEEAAAKILAGGSTTEDAIKVSAQLKKFGIDLEALAAGKAGRITDMASKVRKLNKEVVHQGVGLDV